MIDEARQLAVDGNLFPNVRGRGVISDMSMSQKMKGMKLEARPHGFRSSLRTWLDEATETPWEVKETVLGHAVGTKITRAYARSDYLDERAAILERWGKHVAGARG